MTNTASIEITLGRGQNYHPRIVLTMTQCTLIILVPFVYWAGPGRTPTILSWMPLVKENQILRYHKEIHRHYDGCRFSETALIHYLLRVYEDTYFLPFNKSFMGYSYNPTIGLVIHLYGHYAIILATKLATNNACLQETFESLQATGEPLQEAQQGHQIRNHGYLTNKQSPDCQDGVRPPFINGKFYEDCRN